ncbi:MAG: ribulose 1,5-bisphosphate carboxylase, partial [Candidatus Eremiobacteraeota bacterium]|nr:ribulose 1,5-bisphosphate carboxylase [Candidatus Eremiobacteraeota bacterium]
MAWLTATYLIDAKPDRIEARAEAVVIEQSVECPLDAVRDPRILDEVVARVAAIERAGDGRYRVDVKIAVETTCYEPAQLVNMVFGNCSLWDDVQLVALDLPAALLARF